MPDSLTRLRDADPAARAQTPSPPDDVLRAILATPPQRPRRRAPQIVLAGAALAAAAVVALAALPDTDKAPAPIRASLAERAFAATAPAPDFITYTETTTVQSGPPAMASTDHTRIWQYRDRMHNFMDVTQPRGTWRYEHDQQGKVFRTLVDGKVDAIRSDDPGWRDNEGEEGRLHNVTTLVDRFREHIRGARDMGETTFNGKRAHAYKGKDTTYYVDPDTALPLGSRSSFTVYKPKLDPKTRMLVEGEPDGVVTIVVTVDRYERLEPTPQNLALLDAPNIDAAQAR